MYICTHKHIFSLSFSHLLCFLFCFCSSSLTIKKKEDQQESITIKNNIIITIIFITIIIIITILHLHTTTISKKTNKKNRQLKPDCNKVVVGVRCNFFCSLDLNKEMIIRIIMNKFIYINLSINKS